MNIPKAALEIAARAMDALDIRALELDEETSEWPDLARVALEAASPLIVAQAVRDIASEYARLANINPLTSSWFAVDDLRKRADRLERADG